MPITADTIKLMAAQRLTDAPDGGGRMSAVEIPDGAINALFHGADEIAEVSGRVLLRKAYAAVLTSDTDALYGAHAILTEPPEDPDITVVMFAATVAGDERADAVDRMESYAARSLALPVKPLDDQYANSTALLVPKGGDNVWRAGDIYYIGLEWSEVDVVGLAKVFEYVRIKAVVDEGAYWRLMLTAPLAHTYPAQYQYLRGEGSSSQIITIYPTVLRQTTTDQAAMRYYGVTDLTGALTAGAMSIPVAEHRVPLLPALPAPAVLIDQHPVGYAPLTNRQAPRLIPRLASIVVTSPATQTYTVNSVPALDLSAIEVDYLSAGTVYTLRGAQVSEHGALSYSSALSRLTVSLARLPDVGSRVIVRYAGSADYRWSASSGYLPGGTPLATRIDMAGDASVVPGSLYYNSGTATYYDDGNGVLYRSDSAGVAVVGTVDYDSPGQWFWTITNPIPAGTDRVAVMRSTGTPEMAALYAYVPTDIVPATVALRAEELDGSPVSVTPTIVGRLMSYTFVSPVKPDSIRWDGQANRLDPAPKEQIGIDPLRLPADGRVDLFRPHDVVVVHHTDDYALPNPVVAGAVYNVGRTDNKWVRLYDQAGTPVPSAQYTANPAAGTVTMATPLTLTGLTQPLVARHRRESRSRVRAVDAAGNVDLYLPLDKSMPADSRVSNALIFGDPPDLFARVSAFFDQQTWGGVWENVLIGSIAGASYNNAIYPPILTNKGTITERWALIFDSTTHFRLIGETVGQIGDGYISADFAPMNPVTGEPYFKLKWEGWGLGWSSGNVVRLNTVQAAGEIWLAMIQQPGAAPDPGRCRLEFRGSAA